jgi:hypothetical protein
VTCGVGGRWWSVVGRSWVAVASVGACGGSVMLW